jgi:hypothetical protein
MRAPLTLGLALIAGLALGPAHGQVSRKPDTPPVRADDLQAFDASRWERLYRAGGEPAILVLAGVATAERPGRGVGASLMGMDPGGDAAILRSELERTLLEGRGVEIVSPDALSDADRRDAELLMLSRERDAVDLLSTALDAPLVLVARLQPTTGGAKYRVSFEAIDAARGRTISTVAFDWRAGGDAREIKRYARLLAGDFLDGYERHVAGLGAARPYTVRLLGADMPSLRDLRDRLEATPGVERISVGQRQQSRRTSVADIRVRYTGSAFDLAGELFDAAAPSGLELDSLDMTAGTLVVRAIGGPGRVDPAGTWRSLGPGPAPEIDRAALREAYAGAGEPRIAMLIGRTLSPWELRQPWFLDGHASRHGLVGGDVSATLGGSNVFISIADDITVEGAPGFWGGVVTPEYTPRPAERGLLETGRLEDLLLDRLGPGGLGLRVVDAVTLRERALAERPRFVFREAEIIDLLRAGGMADIAVLGDGRLERRRGATVVRYTLRAVELESGEILAVAPAAVEVDDRADAEEVREILEALASEATARLAADLHEHWTTTP